MARQTICLNMIVKDEEDVIEDTLANILEYVDVTRWVISDTGSSDATRQKITNFFARRKIEGELFDDEWKDFGHNRSVALSHAHGKSDYLLIFDADDRFVGDFALPDKLVCAAYYLQFRMGNAAWRRPVLIDNKKRWVFKGVLHEFLSADGHDADYGDITGDYHVHGGTAGARSRDPDKYSKDAEILAEAYHAAKGAGDGIHTRYGYYCAQSYKDAGMHDDAIKWYKTNIADAGWSQERVVSCLELGKLYAARDDHAMAIHYWTKSIEIDDTRLEGVHKIMLYHLEGRRHDMVMNYYGMVREQLASPIDLTEKLFVDRTPYDYGIDWLAVLAAFYSSKPRYGVEACINIFNHKKGFAPSLINSFLGSMRFYAPLADRRFMCLAWAFIASVSARHPDLVDDEAAESARKSLADVPPLPVSTSSLRPAPQRRDVGPGPPLDVFR